MNNRWLLVVLTGALAMPGSARGEGAKPTPLLEDDLHGRRTKIDAGRDGDAALDAMMGGGDGSFSTKDLERVSDSLRTALARERPRAPPKLLVFLYPGRVSAERLKAMSEILVEMELVIDPCDRSLCRDAVAREIELVGRAVGQAVRQTPSYKVTFETLTLKTVTDLHGGDVGAYRVPMSACVAAAARPGGGAALLDGLDKAARDYVPMMVKSIAQKGGLRRVSFVEPPSVAKTATQVAVTLHIKGDRVRVQTQALDALSAAAAALRENPTTPADTRLEVAVDVPMRKLETRRFRTQGQPVQLFLDKKLDAAALWASYIEEVKPGSAAQRMDFSDGDTHASANQDAPADAPDDNAAIAVLSANFASLADCARAEVARNPKFGGVTLHFQWTPAGRATSVVPREAALRTGPLAACLAHAMDAMRLPRFAGAPREIDYPIRLK